MFIEVDEYLPQLADSVGVLVTVHSPYIALENVSVNENPIFVAPGTSTSVSLRVVGRKPWHHIYHLPYSAMDSQTNFKVAHLDFSEAHHPKFERLILYCLSSVGQAASHIF